MDKIEKTFEMLEKNGILNSTDLELYNNIKNVQRLARVVCDELSDKYAKEIEAIIQKYEPKVTVSYLKDFNMTLREADDNAKFGYNVYSIWFSDKENLLIKTWLEENNWRATFDKSITTRKWGFDLLHCSDLNIEVRKKLDEYRKKIGIYSRINDGAFVMTVDILAELEERGLC